MKVIIKGQEYNFEFGSVWGPLYTYEEYFGEKIPFNSAKMLCVHLMLYCILLRSNKDFSLLLEDFLQELNNMELEKELREYYFNRVKILTSGVPEEAEEDKKKD